MPKTSTNRLPKFKSEAEEAAWYTTPEGQRHTNREFRKALKNGTIIRSDGAFTEDTLRQILAQAKEKITKSISIRLPMADIERAKKIATRRGIGYQTVLKDVIHKSLSQTS
jgi:hypothetical protein